MPDRGASVKNAASTSSVRSAVRTLLAFAETRARLAANEVEEQALRLLEILVWGAAAVLFFCIALVFVSLFIVLIFWDSNRLLAASLVAERLYRCGTRLKSPSLGERERLLARAEQLVADND